MAWGKREKTDLKGRTEKAVCQRAPNHSTADRGSRKSGRKVRLRIKV